MQEHKYTCGWIEYHNKVIFILGQVWPIHIEIYNTIYASFCKIEQKTGIFRLALNLHMLEVCKVYQCTNTVAYVDWVHLFSGHFASPNPATCTYNGSCHIGICTTNIIYDILHIACQQTAVEYPRIALNSITPNVAAANRDAMSTHHHW